MSMSYTRTLTFKTEHLGTDATLLLVFDQASDGLYNDKFPVVWKVVKFAFTGPYHITTTFSSQLAWLQPQINRSLDSIADNSAFTPIHYNQKTTLQHDDFGMFSYTTPEPGTADSVTVVNGTFIRRDVALGFLPDPAFSPVPVFYWSGLGSGASIQTNFQPVLRAYITSRYTDDQIVRGEISAPIIFEQNLAALSDVTVWDLRFDAATGRFSITQA